MKLVARRPVAPEARPSAPVRGTPPTLPRTRPRYTQRPCVPPRACSSSGALTGRSSACTRASSPARAASSSSVALPTFILPSSLALPSGTPGTGPRSRARPVTPGRQAAVRRTACPRQLGGWSWLQCVARISGVDARSPTRERVMRCERTPAVRARAYGSTRGQRWPLRSFAGRRFAIGARHQ